MNQLDPQPIKTLDSSHQKTNAAQKYYDSDDSYRYYSILYTEDYSGCGLYPSEEEVESQDAPGVKY
jgi:hypothetical protein